jgi:hypothetical protein
LTPDQQVQLQSCEAILQLASHTFFEAGLALAEIRDDELFIDEFDSFEAYCQEKWQYGKRYAERLMAAAEVVKRLRTNSSLPSPSYEGQVRPLMGLSPDQAVAAWEKAAEKAGGRKMTARIVTSAVREIVPVAPGKRAVSSFSKAQQQKLLLDTIDELLNLVFQKAPHGDLLEKLQTLHQSANALFPKARAKTARP